MLRFRAFQPLPQPPRSLVRICPLEGSGLVGFLSDEQVTENGVAYNRRLLSALVAEVQTGVGRPELEGSRLQSFLPFPSSCGSSAFLGVGCVAPSSAPIVTWPFIRTPGIRCRAHSNPV